MSKILDSFDIGVNFWEVNKEFKAIGPTKLLWKNDKSRGKENSSKVMWAIVQVYDLDSKFAGIEEPERKILIAKDYYDDPSLFERDSVKELSTFFLECTDTAARKALREWNDKMIERAIFMKQTSYTIGEPDERGNLKGGTAIILDTMMKNTKTLYDNLALINEQLAKEDAAGIGKGGKTASLADSGLI